jgi:hypothetical protein
MLRRSTKTYLLALNTVLAFCLAGLSGNGENKVKAVLHFPANRSMGHLSRMYVNQFDCLQPAPKPFAEARGDIQLAAGEKVELKLSYDSAK